MILNLRHRDIAYMHTWGLTERMVSWGYVVRMRDVKPGSFVRDGDYGYRSS